MASWKENKSVQFAIGVTLTILLIRWLITGDLLFAADVAMHPPAAEGETKSVAIFGAIWPLFFDAMVIVGASAIAWAFKLWDMLYGLLQSASANSGGGSSTATPQAASEAAPVSVDGLVQGLARAAATNDSEAMAKLTVQIRKPYALDALTQAYMEGDLDKAAKLVAELNAMMENKKKGATV